MPLPLPVVEKVTQLTGLEEFQEQPESATTLTLLVVPPAPIVALVVESP